MSETQISNVWELSIERLNEKLAKWTQQASSENRRVYPRVTPNLQVYIINEANNTIIRSWILDISDGGFSVICNTPTDIKEGEKIQAQIFLPAEIQSTGNKIVANTYAILKRKESILSENRNCQKLAFEFETPQHIAAKIKSQDKQTFPSDSIYFG